MTPEEKARVKIDRWFEDAGWQVVNRDEFEPTMSAVAVREGLLKGNLEADYLMFINGKVCGVLEAKREEVNVESDMVSEQVSTYAKSVPNCYQTWQKPIPLLYKSNGKVVLFQDFRKTNTEWDEINRIHTPKEIVSMLGIDDPFAGLPTLRKKGLRECQYEAITELEKSFRSGQNRALMMLATGAGKLIPLVLLPIVCWHILLCAMSFSLLTATISDDKLKMNSAHSASLTMVKLSTPSMVWSD